MSSSLGVGRGLDVELWLAGLFSAAELAAADLLLQLSVAGAGRDDEEAESSTSATTYSSRRSPSPCLVEDLTPDAEEEPERVVEAKALPLGSMELDRRARKRYRLLSELYAATIPVTLASASDGKKKSRKRRHRVEDDNVIGSSSEEEETRYGGDHYRERK
uniref:Uncharacterized protein n=1 Tax=Avena sativa TaxID=4498 RepID=A0ACD5XP18_AVESA